MKRKLFAAILTFILILSLTACGSGDGNQTAGSSAETGNGGQSISQPENEQDLAADAIVLTYSEANPSDSIDGQLAVYFKQQLEELSNGTVTLDIQASGVLGSQTDVLDGMITGSGIVDIARISSFDMNNYGGSKSALLGMPYTIESREHFWNFTQSEAGKEILQEPEDLNLGIKGLFYVEEGFRSFFFTNEVGGIDDVANKKLRVSSDPVLVGVVEALGSSPTVISFNELYSSLQSGIVDGAEQPLMLYESNVFYEVAPYFLEDEHTFSASEVVMTQDAWDSLSEEQQNAVTEAGQRTSVYCQELSAQMEAECRERLSEQGVTFIPVEDKAVYREKCQTLIDQYTADNQTLYQAILDSAN